MDDFVSTKLLRSFSGSTTHVKDLLKNLKKMTDVIDLEAPQASRKNRKSSYELTSDDSYDAYGSSSDDSHDSYESSSDVSYEMSSLRRYIEEIIDDVHRLHNRLESLRDRLNTHG